MSIPQHRTPKMAERSQKAQERVREALERNPDATTQELQEAAQSVEPSISELSRRQFNAGYVLPLKRSASSGKRKGARGGGRKQAGKQQAEETQPQTTTASRPARKRAQASSGDERDQVRAAMLDFAREFSEAESRSAIVAVLADVDRYVDRIIGARG